VRIPESKSDIAWFRKVTIAAEMSALLGPLCGPFADVPLHR